MFKYLLLFFCFPIFSQNITTHIVDSESNINIADVKIFKSGIEIGKTNEVGQFSFELHDRTDTISFVKEGYYDVEVSHLKNGTVIKLKQITPIVLEEVVITKISANAILDSVYNKIKTGKGYSIPNYIHFKNFSKIGKDTLSFINEVLSFKKGTGFFINKNAKIVKPFSNFNGMTYYKIGNKEIKFNIDYTHTNMPYFSYEIQAITRMQNLFNYKLSKADGGYYIITFEPKNEKSEFPYQGRIVIDCIDYGIYEMEYFINNKKRHIRNLNYKDKIVNFEVIEEKGFLKNIKNDDSKYELVQYSFKSILDVLSGDFKKKQFENNCYKESTSKIESLNYVKFNISEYTILN